MLQAIADNFASEVIVATNARTTRKPGQALGWFNPRGRPLGMWAYTLNRITGILLTVYIFFHFVNISFLWLGPQAWNQLMALFRTPPFLVFDVGLLLVLLYHGLNGIRLAVLAMNVGTERGQQKLIFWALMAIGGVSLVYMAFRLFTD